jgi:hypothetical protein
MRLPLILKGASAFAAVALGAALASACSDRAPTAPTASLGLQQQEVHAAIAAQERHTRALLRIPGVVGTAVGLLPNGRAAVRVFVEHRGVPGLPVALDGVPVAVAVTGRFMAFSDPTTKARPAPVGFSVGHPSITAGTIGARVKDGAGNVYVLSNNHVLANSNDAGLGDPALQPGPFDGGTLNDQIGTLSAFQPIDFSLSGVNYFDAAIAVSNTGDLGNSTPADDGYGTPSSAIWGDGDADGLFDSESTLLGLNVQKYGRTTALTKGQITGINGTVEICYEVFFIWCVKSAYFYDQIIIEPGAFSGAGDSGSLIVSDDADKAPVALLFAGSSTQTIANRIDLVLNHFGVTVDGGAAGPPPGPVTDIAITSVSASSFVTQGTTVDVVVTIRNVGNQDVTASFDVTLEDVTDVVGLGTQSVAGLAAGATATRTFSWNTGTSSIGSHTLAASHVFTDDNVANNQASTGVTVSAPSTEIHVGDLDGLTSDDGRTWSAIVEVALHDEIHAPVDGATVVGVWSLSGLASTECMTGELGGNGTCIFLFPGLRKNVKSVTFTVTSVTMDGRTYAPGLNHDVDGSSNGTSITVSKP